MKRIYCKPIVAKLSTDDYFMLASSNQITDVDKGITYGGVDSDGSIDPSVKAFTFEDDEDIDIE